MEDYVFQVHFYVYSNIFNGVSSLEYIFALFKNLIVGNTGNTKFTILIIFLS